MVISAELTSFFPHTETMKPFILLRQLCLLLALLSLGVPKAASTRFTENLLDPSVDYDDVDNPPTRESTTRAGPTRTTENCYKSICEDLPAPCHELAATTGCLCPGVSLGPGALPEAPVVKVFWQAGSAPEVRWCAAPAYKTVYKVLVGGKEVGEFGELTRTTVVKDLSAGAEVCVQASNSVGKSPLEGAACEVYNPPEEGASLALKVGLIGGALGLLLLVLIAVLLWRHRSRRKDGAHVSSEGVL